METKTQSPFIWFFPLTMLLVQLLPLPACLLLGAVLALAALPARRARGLLLLCGFAALGHVAWFYFSNIFLANFWLLSEAAAIWGRFGLLGYIALFALWQLSAPAKQNLLHPGNPKAEIRFPLVWKGHPEPIWRFVLIFCAACLAGFVLLILWRQPRGQALAAGLLFTLVNATLEELLWRGFLLSRALDFAPESLALAATSLAFGFYHLSLGYPLPLCLLFAVGGFYFGGAALRSRGLVAPWLMHLAVNLLMVAAGMLP